MTKNHNHANKNKIVKTAAQTALLMAILTLGSKVLGFVREMVMANYFGTTYVTDAYVMSFTILSVLFGGLIAAIATAYMPIFSNIIENKSVEEGDKFTSSVINLLLLISLLISIIGILFSKQIIMVFASGFSGETERLAVFYVRIFFSYVIFSSVSGILDSYMQYKGIFLPQIISGYLVSFSTIIVIVICSITSYYYLALGSIIGYFLRFITIWIIAKRNNFKYTPLMKPDHNIGKIASLALPAFIGSYMLSINIFIDKTLASKLVEGSISALNYASLLNTMIIGLTISILSTIVYPKLTQANSLDQNNRFNDIIQTGINIVIIIALPCSLGAMLYSNQVVQIVYERGAFNATATSMTSSAFLFYSLGLLFMSLNEFITRIYYSMHNMKTPMIFAGIGVIINVVLNLILVQFMAHNGLALATSIASFINTGFLFNGMRRQYPHISIIQSKKKITLIVVASILAIGLSYLIYIMTVMLFSHIIVSRTAQLFLVVTITAFVYLGLLIVFKIDEVKLIKSILRRN